MGWVSCATLQVTMDLSRPCTQESVVGGRVPRGRPWAGHCTCWFFWTLLPRHDPVSVCDALCRRPLICPDGEYWMWLRATANRGC